VRTIPYRIAHIGGRPAPTEWGLPHRWCFIVRIFRHLRRQPCNVRRNVPGLVLDEPVGDRQTSPCPVASRTMNVSINFRLPLCFDPGANMSLGAGKRCLPESCPRNGDTPHFRLPTGSADAIGWHKFKIRFWLLHWGAVGTRRLTTRATLVACVLKRFTKKLKGQTR
jgi:hypothetical protein